MAMARRRRGRHHARGEFVPVRFLRGIEVRNGLGGPLFRDGGIVKDSQCL
jgi:hypothetical protein